MGNSYSHHTKEKAHDFRHKSQRSRKDDGKRNVSLALPKFRSVAAKSFDQYQRKKMMKDMAPRLVQVYQANQFGHSHLKRDMDNKQKKWLKELSPLKCARDFLDYVLKWISIDEFSQQVLDQTKPISPTLLTVVCAYASPGTMRADMKWGNSKNPLGASTTFAGAIANQPMATFSSGFGVNKIHYTKKELEKEEHERQRKNSIENSMYYPIAHMILFMWFHTQLPDTYHSTLSDPQCYISILLNCWSRLHGGVGNRERKKIGTNNHDTLVTHCGQFSGGHFLIHLNQQQVAAVGNIGALGTCPPTVAADVTVDVDRYHWGSPAYVPTEGPLAGTAAGVAADKLFAVSAQNVVLGTSSNFVHGASDFILDTERCPYPCKFTVVCAVRASKKPGPSPTNNNAVAVFSQGQRLTGLGRPQVVVKRVAFTKQ